MKGRQPQKIIAIIYYIIITSQVKPFVNMSGSLYQCIIIESFSNNYYN